MIARRERLENSLLWPLNMFCRRGGRTLPDIWPLRPQHIPQPYRELLVHDQHMTSTLEAYHEGTIHITPLQVVRAGNELSREVILRMDGSNHPVEYGASRVFMDRLPEEARDLVVEGVLPLGTILKRCACANVCDLGGIFRLAATEFFGEVLESTTGSVLYGRRNTLRSPDGQPLAEVCEVLPPEEDETQR